MLIRSVEQRERVLTVRWSDKTSSDSPADSFSDVVYRFPEVGSAQ